NDSLLRESIVCERSAWHVPESPLIKQGDKRAQSKKRNPPPGLAQEDPAPGVRLFSNQEQALPGGAGSRRARTEVRLHRPQAEEAHVSFSVDRAYLGRL